MSISRHWFNPPTTKEKQRAFVLALADRIAYDEPHLVNIVTALRILESHMYNRNMTTTRARKVSLSMSPAVVANIHYLHAADPKMPQHEIGNLAGVNQGRVNNTINGVRK